MLASFLVAGCSGADGAPEPRSAEAPPADGRLFTSLPSSYTGVRFENRLVDAQDLNVFTYRNFYNGGGVALGDLTGDGLPELMLTSNLGPNRLYLNAGDLGFRDVTGAADVGAREGWATGVTFADVNGDGLLDIYVCYAGRHASEQRANALYVHQGLNDEGVPVFREMAAEYGIADTGYSTHAAFFDYDRDGRLDLYVVNNSPRPVSSFSPWNNIRESRSAEGGDRLYRNTGERFLDVSEEAGIFGSEAAFGLGVAVGDLNRDGWPDFYVSNDFFERDYLYINRRDGSFAEVLDAQMPSISYASMGLDLADIDNDGWLDLYVTDMLPEDDQRLKTVTSFESWDAYQANLEHGYHHQLTRNTLQRNNGNGSFSEIGELAGVARTDWSWSALIADLDLDGHKDIHVTNGIPRDLTSQDYIAFLADQRTKRATAAADRVDFVKLVEATTSTPIPNYAFRNRGDLTFADESAAWGLDTPGFSNGAAYGDLDGDGDLDLVVNSVGQEAAVYRNNAREQLDHRFLQVRLEGTGPNTHAIGARVTLRGGGQTFVQELMPSRGFQSSVDYVLTFGIGQLDSVEALTVDWPDGRVSALGGIAANQRVSVRQSEASAAEPPGQAPPAPLFRDVTEARGMPVTHRENDVREFRREPLIPRALSMEGPHMAVADVNGDGLDDAFIGGAKEQAGHLLLQRADGRFAVSQVELFERDRVSEDVGAVFFDADGNGAPDLYVVSGGSEFSDLAPALQDRLYLNDGRGRFRKAEDHLPPIKVSGSRAAPADFDGDGDMDLFVGGRVVPWRYGLDPLSVLLENDGSGRFTEVTDRVAPGLARVGMVTDALWEDLDDDGRPDLLLVGDWMPVTVFRNDGATLRPLAVPGLEKSHGWWNRIVAGDFTGDGRIDFVVGNLGMNSRLRASEAEPATLHVKDFDRNGFVEQILGVYDGGVSRPVALREDLVRVLPSLRARYPDFASYARQPLADLFPDRQLDDATVRSAYTFATSLLRNDGDGSFTMVPLPLRAQMAPVYGILARDLDRDGVLDLLLAGNFDGFKPEIGRMAAAYGLFLRGSGDGRFSVVEARVSGFHVPGQARDIQRLRTRAGELYVVTRNDDRPLVFRTGSSAPAITAARTPATGPGEP
ncbi:MAG: VCBS repeat-containing protein [Gemmatimonadetes bacterium]|nr:VCBS repeat-containing protein [Gemmatimonadota bacterium]